LEDENEWMDGWMDGLSFENLGVFWLETAAASGWMELLLLHLPLCALTARPTSSFLERIQDESEEKWVGWTNLGHWDASPFFKTLFSWIHPTLNGIPNQGAFPLFPGFPREALWFNFFFFFFFFFSFFTPQVWSLCLPVTLWHHDQTERPCGA